jgi:hypothetical protein
MVVEMAIPGFDVSEDSMDELQELVDIKSNRGRGVRVKPITPAPSADVFSDRAKKVRSQEIYVKPKPPVTVRFDPADIKMQGEKNFNEFDMFENDGKSERKILHCSRTEGTTLFPPISKEAIAALSCMYPDAKELPIDKCGLKAAVALIAEYKDKECKLVFDQKIIERIQNLKETPENKVAKELFLDYCAEKGLFTPDAAAVSAAKRTPT